MKIQTKYYGEQTIAEKDVIRFPSGLPGFADQRRYVLQPFGDVFAILQSLDDVQIALMVTSPFLFYESYCVDLPDSFVKQLEIDSEQDAGIWAVISVKSPFAESTANLRAPIVINMRKRIGKQYIPDHSPYSLHEPLFQKKGKRA
ncbi:MAG: flagellar assembly protein FliW [Sporolactobacillus sp.]|nr:flagellar assembly protein FliW [Sporolactobacillus sp.]MCI1880888.1 flagellar assembly protein FliW [Sporolactobacillus sp.]